MGNSFVKDYWGLPWRSLVEERTVSGTRPAKRARQPGRGALEIVLCLAHIACTVVGTIWFLRHM